MSIPAKKGFHLIPCPGEAHRPEVGGMIDNCSVCAPRWGQIEVPVAYATLAEYREAIADGRELTANQKKFVRAAKRAGLQVTRYSGRYMFGRFCPAVYVDHGGDFKTRAQTRIDSMGKGLVIYAQD